MFVLSIVWFVHFYFSAGRLWLACAVSGFRLLGLVLNFVTGVNVNFQEVSSLDPVRPVGRRRARRAGRHRQSLGIVPQVGNLLLVVFVVDASVTLWRRGGADARRRAAVVGGSVAGLRRCGRGLCRLDHARGGACADDRHAGRLRDRAGDGLRARLGHDRGGATGGTAARQRAALPGGRRSGAECDPAGRRQGYHHARQRAGRGRVRLPARGTRRAAGGDAASGTLSRPARRPARPRTPADPQTRAMGAGRELFARRKDGSEIPVEVALSPMSTEKGLFVLASVVDITERRRARAGCGAPARRARAPVAGGDAGRVVRIAGARTQPAADGHPEQCAGGAALSRAEPAARGQARGDPGRHREERSPCGCGDSAASLDAQEGGDAASSARHQRRGRGVVAPDAQRPAEPPCQSSARTWPLRCPP